MSSNDWKINKEGIEFLESIKDNQKKKAVNHKFAFQTEKHGLTIISYISIEKRHVVTLVNGAFLNDYNVDLDSFKKSCAIEVNSDEKLAEQIHLASIRNLIKNDLKNTILNKFPELSKFME